MYEIDTFDTLGLAAWRVLKAVNAKKKMRDADAPQLARRETRNGAQGEVRFRSATIMRTSQRRRL